MDDSLSRDRNIHMKTMEECLEEEEHLYSRCDNQVMDSIAAFGESIANVKDTEMKNAMIGVVTSVCDIDVKIINTNK